jgi:hypothetical protein
VAAPLIAAVAFAALASAAAIALPLLGQPVWMAYAVGGIGAALGLAAVVLSALARFRLLGFAGTGLFLAAAALLVAVATDRSVAEAKAAADQQAAAKAQEESAKLEQEKFAGDKQAAAEALKKADELRAAAADDRAKVEDAPIRAAKLVQEAKALEAKAVKAAEQLKADQEELLEQTKAEQAKLDKQKAQIEIQAKALAAERAKVDEAKKAAADLAKQADAAKEEAAQLRKQGEAEREKAKQALDQAAQKEQEAQKHLKKFEELLEGVKLKLKSKLPAERRNAVLVLNRAGSSAAAADYDLCWAVTFDPDQGIRQEALEALEKVRPALYPLIVSLTLPIEGGTKGKKMSYVAALEQLPAFGRAGLPFIAAQLQGRNAHLEKSPPYSMMVLRAQVEALAKIAREDKTALAMLLSLPDSPLATATKQSKGIVGLDADLHKRVGEQLHILGKDRPETRKSIVPYFIAQLQSEEPSKAKGVSKTREVSNRVSAINALAAFGPDAAPALPVLRKMRLDPSQQVRDAVNSAIATIEKANK